MHRLLLIAGALCLTIGTVSAQPAWPDASPEPGLERIAEPPIAGQLDPQPRRITPRGGSTDTSDARGDEPIRRPATAWTAFGCLAVILIVIVAAARLWKKHGPTLATGLPAEALEVLGKRQLDRRHAIQMIRCGPRILILGVADEGLRTLAEISDPVEVDYLAGLCRRSDSDESGGKSFLSLFRRFHENTSTLDAPEFRGRVDQVLAERFSRSTAGVDGRSEGLARA